MGAQSNSHMCVPTALIASRVDWPQVWWMGWVDAALAGVDHPLLG